MTPDFESSAFRVRASRGALVSSRERDHLRMPRGAFAPLRAATDGPPVCVVDRGWRIRSCNRSACLMFEASGPIRVGADLWTAMSMLAGTEIESAIRVG